jgi:hypothetical protein
MHIWFLLQAQEAVASMKQRQAMITHDLLGKLSGSAADADLLRHKLDVSQTELLLYTSSIYTIAVRILQPAAFDALHRVTQSATPLSCCCHSRSNLYGLYSMLDVVLLYLKHAVSHYLVSMPTCVWAYNALLYVQDMTKERDKVLHQLEVALTPPPVEEEV